MPERKAELKIAAAPAEEYIDRLRLVPNSVPAGTNGELDIGENAPYFLPYPSHNSSHMGFTSIS
jgi:hypothetical protein